jgi:hypothetical protein
MLLVAVFLVALLVISLSVSAPKIAKSLQRDHDLETFHRGMQYRRAIQLYYRKFHAYPPNVDALVNTNDIRFLRKKYTDPVTGKDDWKPVLFGQNKTPTAMGFFGQPLSGGATSIAGTGPSGGVGLPGVTPMGGGSSSSFGSSSSGSGGSIFGPSSDNSGNSSSGTSGTTGSTSGTSTSGSGNSSSGSSGSSSGLSGQTFGGAGIIGFSPGSDKQSILVYKKKNHYNEWEFTYDPLSEMQTIPGGNAGTIGQPASSTSSPVGSSGLGSSTNSGGFSLGGSGSTGVSSSPVPAVPQPTSSQ